MRNSAENADDPQQLTRKRLERKAHDGISQRSAGNAEYKRRNAAFKLDAHMRAIDDVAKALEKVSYGIGDGLTDGTLKVQESRAEAERLREKLKGLLEERNLVHRHLLSAFPRLSQTEYRAAFERIQEHRKNLSEKVKNKANEIRENK